MSTPTSSTPDWLGVHEALERILSRVRPLPFERIAADQASGRTLAAEICARLDLPARDNAAMDGWAVHSDDLREATPAAPVRLQIAGRIAAGDPDPEPLPRGSALRIMTGAPIPPGADAVIRVEDTNWQRFDGTPPSDPGQVVFTAPCAPSTNVRPAAQDLRREETVVERGTAFSAGVHAAVAAAGHAHVTVTRCPRVAIVPTGNELVDAASLEEPSALEAAAQRGSTPDSNGPMLVDLVHAAGGDAQLQPIAPDTPHALRETLSRALATDPDVLVTIGGVSMGDADHVRSTLSELGLTLEFWRVRMRPGSPLAFGRMPNGTLVLMLPGNPASAFVTFHLFVRPLLRTLLGDNDPHLPVLQATAAQPLPSTARLCQFHRVVFDLTAPSSTAGASGAALPTVRLTGATGSGLVSGLATTQGLAVIPEGIDRLEAGMLVECVLIGTHGAGPGFGSRTPGYRATTS